MTGCIATARSSERGARINSASRAADSASMERPAALSARLLRRAHRDEGFSLIEALVALVILGIVGSGFSYGMTLTLQTTRDARLRQQATHLAEREIEIARHLLALGLQLQHLRP